MAKALRGDLIAVTRRTTGDVQVGVITNITATGIAKRWCPIGSTAPIELNPRLETWKIIEAAQVRVEGVIAMVRAHHWPGHPEQIMPFASEQELKDALVPHLNRHLEGVPVVDQLA